MKKLGLLLVAIFSITLLSACNSVEDTNTTENTTSEVVVDKTVCKAAIQEYLDGTNPEGSQSGPKAEAGDQVIAMYVGRFNDEEVFDTNVKSVAEACGLPYYPSMDE
jgi:FKBP-type peptidyl-prolyl cis-trans isomerase